MPENHAFVHMVHPKFVSRDRFTRLFERVGVRASASEWHKRLTLAWSEPQRHYHNLEHLEECLTHFDQAAHLCEDPTAVEIALWFHDAVYDPKAPDNEEQSALLATQFLREDGDHEAFIAKVERLILATKTHDAGGDHDARIMLDIDLSILGQSEERFDRYEEDVRREFEWVPTRLFLEKRAAILESFLGRPSVYQTSWFRERYEAQARENLRRSATQLRSAPNGSAP